MDEIKNIKTYVFTAISASAIIDPITRSVNIDPIDFTLDFPSNINIKRINATGRFLQANTSLVFEQVGTMKIGSKRITTTDASVDQNTDPLVVLFGTTVSVTQLINQFNIEINKGFLYEEPFDNKVMRTVGIRCSQPITFMPSTFSILAADTISLRLLISLSLDMTRD